MSTYICNKCMEFNFLMLQLLKLIKINHCQWYKSHFLTVCIFVLPGMLWLVAKKNIQCSLLVPYLYVMNRPSVLII